MPHTLERDAVPAQQEDLANSADSAGTTGRAQPGVGMTTTDEKSLIDGDAQLFNPREQVIRQVSSLLGLTVAADDKNDFWYQTGLSLGLTTDRDDAAIAAKQVLEHLDQEWDDDYIEEGGHMPSIEAYETLYESLLSRSTGDVSPEGLAACEEADEEDDGLGVLPAAFGPAASTTANWASAVLTEIRAGTLILNPDWQRKFVWKLKKQRRLVESILLGLPIPSMLLFRDSETGLTYVIDGRQRLETLKRFTAGKPNAGEVKQRFKTFPANEENWGLGEKLGRAAGKYYDDLPQDLKTQFDHTPLVIHEFNDLPRENLYQIFRRYNTGGEKLKAAEIRNAVYQHAPLHEMMYRLAGELGQNASYSSAAEREAATTLTQIMRRKTARYGAYDFVGRYFAFSYMTAGTVANSTNDFMSKFKNNDVNALREEFIRVLNTTCDWYDVPLSISKDGQSVAFHSFIATIQMVSTRTMLLSYVDSRRASPEAIKIYIAANWAPFVDLVLAQKQNATAFWHRQREWTLKLESNCVTS